MKVRFAMRGEFTPYQRVILKRAMRTITPDPVEFIREPEGGEGILGFGVNSEYSTLAPKFISTLPTAERILARDLRRYFGWPDASRKEPVPQNWSGRHKPRVLYFDIESHSSDEKWNLPPEEFFRLGQYAWGANGSVVLTRSREELLEAIRSADLVVGHNIHAFDLSVLFGKDSTEPLEMARDGKVFDTFVFAQMALPAPTFFYTRSGARRKISKPEEMLTWFGLDNLAFQLDVTGKIGDLKAMAKEYGGFCHIPLDNQEFLDYAVQDVIALQEVTSELLAIKKPDAYDWREQVFAGICAQNSRNGFNVDVEKATARRDFLAARKDSLMSRLVAEYDFPTVGKKPWSSAKGKAAIERILADYGITPETTDKWTRTDKGNLSFGGEVIKAITEGTDAEELGEQLAELMGQRSLAQLTLDCVQSDGRVHPEITFLQRSGRCCLPDTHKLLTKRGILDISDVVVGDETLDMRNRWVAVKNIFRYQDQETIRYSSSRTTLEATAEHRWVQRSESGGTFTRSVEPMRDRSVLQLTPDAYPFDRNDHEYPQGMTDREVIAAMVGLFVTDGRATVRTDSVNSATFYVYQSEGKFYRQMRDLIPEHWIASDTSRSGGHWTTPIHNIRLKSSVVRPILEDLGLEFSQGLRHSSTLLPWILTLSQQETLAFLTSVYLSDGNVTGGSTLITSRNPNLIPVFQIAAYRSGYRSKYRVYEGSQGRLALLRDSVHTRTLNRETFQSDVWCVETDSGTFTAWNAEGPYLTGNSTTKPGLTVWSSRDAKKAVEKAYYIPDAEDHRIFGFDFSNADARIVAACSGDVEYGKRFIMDPLTGEEPDGHEINGRLVFGDDTYESNPKKYRSMAKACIAEGSLVLTDKGLVPIEDVSTQHRVWDGIEWVTHDGVIYKGLKEVITYDGLTATPDHKVFRAGDGEVVGTLEDSRNRGLHLTVSGRRGQSVRVSESGQPLGGRESRQKSQTVRMEVVRRVPRLPHQKVGQQGQPKTRVNIRLPKVHTRKEVPISVLGSFKVVRRQATLRKPQEARVPELRGSWSNVRLPDDSRRSDVCVRESDAFRPKSRNRPNRQLTGLRAGKPSNGYSTRKLSKSKNLPTIPLRTEILAIQRESGTETDFCGYGPRPNNPERPRHSNPKEEELSRDRSTARVYDILNAGPRHRFTTMDKLVSNCGHAWNYGGGPSAIMQASKEITEDVATKFVTEMAKAFTVLGRWQNRIRRDGEKGYIYNDWGRLMLVTEGKSYTQSPALIGQSGTRELMVDGLIKLLHRDLRIITYLKAQIHDEVLFSIPLSTMDEDIKTIVECMETVWEPLHSKGQPIPFPVAHSKPSQSWEEAGH